MELDNGITLLLGGVRSGKSDLAVRLGRSWTAAVTFAATALAFDHDMATRIARHELDRPDTWRTVEEPRFGADDVARVPTGDLLIVDCVTLLVSNLMLAELPVRPHIEAMVDALGQRGGPTVVVSNEVGMGVHPETDLGMAYRDELGRANQLLADRADTALLLVAGRAVPLERIGWAS
jgi:adenosyl cobinamide kinase/adenosyl cobinamide phosphate guanylyltransferase